MPSVLTGVFTLPTGVFCFCVYFLVRGMRQASEARFPALKKNYSWTNIILPSAPIVLGGLLATTVVNYPYPPAFVGGLARCAFGIVMGGFSGWAYRIFKKIVVKQFGVADTEPPPADPGVPPVVIPKQDEPPADGEM